MTNGTNIKTIHYLDGFQYVNGDLSFFPHAEGYVRINGNPTKTKYWYDYVYNYTDHLGNIRLSYTKDRLTGELKVLEENHYYPFGLEHGLYNKPRFDILYRPNLDNTEILARMDLKYKYKYNGKEYQDELGLNVYDYGARNYMPDLGRWMQIDPMAEKYLRHSPFNYVGNNPIIRIDPDGMIWDDPLAALRLMNSLSDRMNSLASDISKWENEISEINSNEKLNDKQKERRISRRENKISDAKNRQAQLEQSIDDVLTLGLDDNTYAFSSSTRGDGKHGVRQGSDGKIYIEGGNDNLKTHEIRHVVQALNTDRGLIFNSDEQNYLSAPLNANQLNRIDIYSETEIDAYKAGYGVDGNFPGSVNKMEDINVHTVGEIRDSNGELVYPLIKKMSDHVKEAEKRKNKK